MSRPSASSLAVGRLLPGSTFVLDRTMAEFGKLRIQTLSGLIRFTYSIHDGGPIITIQILCQCLTSLFTSISAYEAFAFTGTKVICSWLWIMLVSDRTYQRPIEKHLTRSQIKVHMLISFIAWSGLGSNRLSFVYVWKLRHVYLRHWLVYWFV
jgi:hypothetical protein